VVARGQARRAKEPAWAIRYLTNAIELGYPGHAIWAERSACYGALEEYEEALEDALVCIRLNPLAGVGFARKGEALMGSGMLNAAELAFTDGLQVNPGLAVLMSGVAEVRQRRVVAAFGDNVHWYPPPFVTMTWKAAVSTPPSTSPGCASPPPPTALVPHAPSTCAGTDHSAFLSVPLEDLHESHGRDQEVQALAAADHARPALQECEARVGNSRDVCSDGSHVAALMVGQQAPDKDVRQTERRLSCESSECGQNPDARSVDANSPVTPRKPSKKKRDWYPGEKGGDTGGRQVERGGDSTPDSDETPNPTTATTVFAAHRDASAFSAPNQESKRRAKGFNIADAAYGDELLSPAVSGWMSGDEGSPVSEVCVYLAFPCPCSCVWPADTRANALPLHGRR